MLMKAPEMCMTRAEMNKQISKGRLLVTLEHRLVLDIAEWILIHPGGYNTLHFMVGKDITDNLHAFHPPYVWQEKAFTFAIAQLVQDGESPITEKDLKISKAFIELDLKLRAEGYYNPDYWYYLNQAVVL
eukprot:Partr_v1_DN22831_c1_g1_i1_m77395 putative Fatty acid desaturase